MKKITDVEMFFEALRYIDKCHSNNPLDFVTNVYVFYYMSGRFPDACIRDVCTVVEALRTHYLDGFKEFPFD